MAAMNIATVFLVPLFLGYAGYLFLLREQHHSWPAVFAIAFGLGMGALTQWMLLLSAMGIPLSRGSISWPLLAVAGGLLFLARKRKALQDGGRDRLFSAGRVKDNSLTRWRWLTVVLVLYITFQMAFVFWRAFHIPIYVWDELFVIAIKAKVFFYEQGLLHLKVFDLTSYPLHVPLSLAWVAFNLGHWDEQLIKIIFPVIYGCYVVLHFDFLSSYVSRFWALAGAALLVSANYLNFLATIAYRDVFLMYYTVVALMLLLKGNETKSSGILTLAGLFLGFATFTKLEATGYLGVMAVFFIYLLVRRTSGPCGVKFGFFMRFIIPALVIEGFYIGYQRFHGIAFLQGRSRFAFSEDMMMRAGEILFRFGENLFFSGNWNILWVLLVISIVANRRQWREPVVQNVLAGLLLFFVFLVSVALLTTNFISLAGEYTYTTLSRLFLHFFPLCPLLIVLLSAEPKGRGSS